MSDAPSPNPKATEQAASRAEHAAARAEAAARRIARTVELGVVSQISAFVTAAFGLVAALAWNTAIQAVFDAYLQAGTGVVAKLLYALIVSVIAILIVIWIGALATRAKAKLADEPHATR